MNIQNIRSIQAYKTDAVKPTKKKNVASKASKLDIKDTYEPSSTNDRAQLLESIKKRVKSGYYNSNDVVDDLSSSFAEAFNNAL